MDTKNDLPTTIGKYHQSHSKGMKKEIIDLLKEIRLGETYSCFKGTDDIEKETQSVLVRLYRLEARSFKQNPKRLI